MPKDTALAALIEQAVAKGTYETFAITAAQMGEEWAREILKDPTIRAQFTTLVREAFARALADLAKEPDNG